MVAQEVVLRRASGVFYVEKEKSEQRKFLEENTLNTFYGIMEIDEQGNVLSSKNITNQDWYKKSVFIPNFAKAADITAQATPQSWKEDYKRAISEFMQGQQCPAPVTKVEPSTAAPTDSGTNTVSEPKLKEKAI